MNPLSKLAAFAVAMAAVFAGAVGAGQWVGPDEETLEPQTHEASGGHAGGKDKADKAGEGGAAGHGEHGGSEAVAVEGPPAGLQVAQDGYRLVPETTTLRPGVRTDFRFSVRGPNGEPLTEFAVEHEKRLHLIVASRDASSFQHVHPDEVEPGVWSIPLTLPNAGAYRAFADFRPGGAESGLTLGTDLFAPGKYVPVELPEPRPEASIDDYTVTVDGDLVPGETSSVTLTVRRNGEPVTDLQPYLGAYGHLVALRDGDLAYLHVHPEGTPGDGTTEPGPRIDYQVEVPSEGRYRLYLDFRHGDVVRTAAFVAETSESSKSSGTGESADDGHGHGGEHG